MIIKQFEQHIQTIIYNFKNNILLYNFNKSNWSKSPLRYRIGETEILSNLLFKNRKI